MTATGRLAPEFVAKGRFEEDCVQGLEFSGRTQKYYPLFVFNLYCYYY